MLKFLFNEMFSWLKFVCKLILLVFVLSFFFKFVINVSCFFSFSIMFFICFMSFVSIIMFFLGLIMLVFKVFWKKYKYVLDLSGYVMIFIVFVLFLIINMFLIE